MPNIRQLKRRIQSVKNTAKITNALQLVAASKMRRAQDRAPGGLGSKPTGALDVRHGAAHYRSH